MVIIVKTKCKYCGYERAQNLKEHEKICDENPKHPDYKPKKKENFKRKKKVMNALFLIFFLSIILLVLTDITIIGVLLLISMFWISIEMIISSYRLGYKGWTVACIVSPLLAMIFYVFVYQSINVRKKMK